MVAALILQIVWILLSIAWNVAGVIAVSQGRRALGPIASLRIATVLAVVGVGFLVSQGAWPIVYAILSVAGLIAAVPNSVKSFTADPGLWPSDLCRYAGGAINAIGTIGNALALANVLNELSR